MPILVDPEDSWLLKAYSWYKSKAGRHTNYLSTYIRNAGLTAKTAKFMYLHHAIMGKPINGLVIDHINGNGLDNRKSNLRIVSNRMNILNQKRKNKTGFRGVYLYSDKKRYYTQIRIGKKRKFLGIFKTPEKAHLAYLTELNKIERM